MTGEKMTDADLLALLAHRVERAKGQRAFARMHGFSAAYVNDVLHGRRGFSNNMCAAIGVKRVVVFTKATDGR